MKRKSLLFVLIILYSSCKKNNEPVPLTEAENAPFNITNEFAGNAEFLRSNTVFASPIIYFNLKEGQKLEDGSGMYRYYPVLDSIIITSNTRKIPLEWKWDEDKDTLSVNILEKLDVNTNCKVTVISHWKWARYSSYQDYKKDRQIVYERKEFSFFTGETKPDTLDAYNISSSYPENRQYFFLKNESNKGFIYFKLNEDDNFPANTSNKYYARFFDGSTSIDKELQYDKSLKRLSFDIPQELANEKIYRLSIIGKSSSNEKEMYKIHFRTSKYNNAVEKLNAIAISGVSQRYISPPIRELILSLSSEEGFDISEIKASNYDHSSFLNDGFLQFDLDTANEWIRKLKMQYYDHYNINNLNIKWREKSSFGGFPPTKNIVLKSNPEVLLTDEEISSFKSINKTSSSQIIIKTDYIGWKDFDDIRQIIANKRVLDSWELSFINYFYDPISP